MLEFKTFLFGEVIVTSEMRLCKLNDNNRVKNNNHHLFCTKWQASEKPFVYVNLFNNYSFTITLSYKTHLQLTLTER